MGHVVFSLELFNAVYVSGKGALRAGLSLYTHQEMSVNLELLAPQSVPMCSAVFQDAALRPYSYLSAGELEPIWPMVHTASTVAACRPCCWSASCSPSCWPCCLHSAPPPGNRAYKV